MFWVTFALFVITFLLIFNYFNVLNSSMTPFMPFIMICFVFSIFLRTFAEN